MPDANGGQKTLSDPLKLEFTDGYEPPCEFWETNMGLLQEQLFSSQVKKFLNALQQAKS